MGVATEEDIFAEKRRWLKRTMKEDERHAALFCPVCIRYIGSAAACDCNPGRQDVQNCTCNPERPGDCRSFGCDPDCEEC